MKKVIENVMDAVFAAVAIAMTAFVIFAAVDGLINQKPDYGPAEADYGDEKLEVFIKYDISEEYARCVTPLPVYPDARR